MRLKSYRFYCYSKLKNMFLMIDFRQQFYYCVLLRKNENNHDWTMSDTWIMQIKMKRICCVCISLLHSCNEEERKCIHCNSWKNIFFLTATLLRDSSKSFKVQRLHKKHQRLRYWSCNASGEHEVHPQGKDCEIEHMSFSF